jgi:hypothetical protein
MKFFNKKKTHLLTVFTMSACMIALFQNCAQTGTLSLSTQMEVAAQNMSNTFYVLKNVPQVSLKPILTNKEASAMMMKPINNQAVADSGNFKVSDSENSTDPTSDSADSETPDIFEIQLPKAFPLLTPHGSILSIDKKTGIFVYEPQADYVGEDKIILDKKIKMEVTAETKEAVKDEDGKYYLVKVVPIPIKIVIHSHETPSLVVQDPTKMQVSSADEEIETLISPVESDKTSPEKPLNVDDGKFPDKLTQSAKIKWNHSSDKDTGINFYEVAVGTKPGDVDVVKWTNVGFVDSATVNGKFTPDATYYTSLRAVDFAGLRSEVVMGDGWQAIAMTNEPLSVEISAPMYSAGSQLEFKIKFTQPVDKFANTLLTISNITGAPVVTGSSRNYTVTAVSNLNGSAELKISKSAIVDILGNRNASDVTAAIIRPKTPTGLIVGSIPTSLNQSPTLSWAADASGSDKGWASYTVNVYSGTTLLKTQPNFTMGSSVSGLSLVNGNTYTLKVKGTDSFGNVGAESAGVSWTPVVCIPERKVINASGTYKVPAACTSITVKVWGQGGGSSYCNGFPDGPGGGGGYVTGTLSTSPGTVWTIKINEGAGSGFNAGGGYAGILLSATPYLIAGGGGAGDANTTEAGGAGGSNVGGKGTGPSPGSGGTQSSGGTGGSCGSWGGPNSSGYLQGSGGWSGGGGGYYGGSCGSGGSGAGGGSSYVIASATNPLNIAGSGANPGNMGDPDREGAGIGDPGSNCNPLTVRTGRVVIYANP